MNSSVPRYEELGAEAEATVRTYSPEEAVVLWSEDGVLFVDVRETLELAAGMIRGAVHVPRGRLEAHLAPDSSPVRNELDVSLELVFYCATGSRSALAGQQARQLGLEGVAHLDGGFSAWLDADGPTQEFDLSEHI